MPPQAILIVGGGLGIGFEVTKSILTTSASANVVVFGLHADPEFSSLQKSFSRRLFVLLGDVASASDRKKAIQTCVQETGGIDTLVYCTGVIGPIERTDKVDIEDVKRSYDINVFGAMAISQLCLPYLRNSRSTNPTNVAFGKAIILSSGCDADVTYMGWMPYCTSKAALTRFIQLLAHEETMLSIQGVYPKLTRTKMPEDVIAGKYRGIMADHEIEKFRLWNEIGDEMVEPASWCGEAIGKLALGLYVGGRSGEALNYDEHVPNSSRKNHIPNLS